MSERYQRVGAMLEGARLLPPCATDADARALGWASLRRPQPWREVEAAAWGRRRWLGLYSDAMLGQCLARFGVLEAVARASGLPIGSLRLDWGDDPTAEGAQRLRLWADGLPADAPLLSVSMRREFVLREGLAEGWPSVSIERFEVSHPRRRFDAARGWPLPGQRRPGMGLLEVLVPLMRRWTQAVGGAALTQIPEFFHGAVTYARVFSYVGPRMRGLLATACQRLLGRALPQAARLATDSPRAALRRRRRLAKTSWAFEWGLVRADARPLLWPTELQAFALDPAFWRGLSAAAPPRLWLDHRALRPRWDALLRATASHGCDA